jgi:hypothetical protein
MLHNNYPNGGRMRHTYALQLVAVGFISAALALPTSVLAKPKGTWQSCTTADLNTNFGSSCNNQMQDDIMKGHSYTHVLFCGGETMLCCTIDNNTGAVQTCRKPAGAHIMPGTGTNPGIAGTAGVQRRGVEGGGAADEETPVPADLTPEVGKESLKHAKTK